MGAGAADIMKTNTPDFLASMSTPERFLFSLFATTHAGYETLPHLKLPFTVSLAELRPQAPHRIRASAALGPCSLL